VRTLNLGILAHVDAGKTTLTERLLYNAGVIDEIGSVDAGTTQTDSLALERQRGITIKSAVVSFVLDAATINLIDTPGHPDFIAEVERVLNVLDGAVLVVSAVEGVQAQTRVLFRTLQRLRLPTLLFVNKIDRAGADATGTLRAISEKLSPSIVAMGGVQGLGTRDADYRPYGPSDSEFVDRLADVLSFNDDTVVAAYLAGDLSYHDLRHALVRQTHKALVHPVFFGSAITGAGVEALMAGIPALLSASATNVGGPASGRVFKVERGAAGEKIAYVRVFSGTLRTRERVALGQGREGKVTKIQAFGRGETSERASLSAGQIGKLWGLPDVKIGDVIGHGEETDQQRHFAPPTMETVVAPMRRRDKGRLHAALAQLAEQDPLINVRQDDVRQEIYVSLYGEVQKEVIQATLADDYGIAVRFHETTTLCVERPNAVGTAVEFMGESSNPFKATVGLRIEPAATPDVGFRLEIERGSFPLPFLRAVEETVRQTLQQGLHGWQVVGCTVVLTHTGYVPPPPGGGWSAVSSSAGDFRHLTPLVLMAALRRAGTTVYEPVHRAHLEVPADTLRAVVRAFVHLGGITTAQVRQGSFGIVEGTIPAAQVHALRQRLPSLTRGEGIVESDFDDYRPVSGTIPRRRRTDHNPSNRKEYLSRVAGRLGSIR